MKRQFLTLSIVAALTACGSSDDDNIVTAPTAPVITGDLSGLVTKSENPTGTVTVNDVNPGESLVYPETFDGIYGRFVINAAGEWTYTLYRGADENPEVTALVRAGLPDLSESFTIRTADLTEQVIAFTIRGIDVPATFNGDISNRIVKRDTGNGDAQGTITVSDANPEEAFFAAAEEHTLTTVYGTTTFDPTTGAWTYDLDEENEAVIALAPDASMPDTFTVRSLDGTEQVVTVLVVGSEPVPASFTPFTNLTTMEDGAFSARISVDDTNFTSSLAVQDPNYQEASMVASDAIATQYGSVTVDAQGVWTYSIDYNKDGVSDLYYTEATDTPPVVTDTFVLTSVDGTEATVSIELQGAQLVPAVITGFPVIDDEGVSSSVVNANVTTVSGSLSINDPNFGQSSFMPETVNSIYGALTIAENGDWSYELSAESVASIQNNTLTLPFNEQISVSSIDGTTQMVEVSIVALEPGNFGVRVGANDGGNANWVINMPDTTTSKGKATFNMRFPDDATRDAKLVFHGRTYKGTELHRTMLALTVRANGELRLNNNTGNGRTFTLNNAITKGAVVPVEFTWDSSAGGLAVLSLRINDQFISADDFAIAQDGTFQSLAVASSAGLQANGPDFFEVQTRLGSTFDIDDFKVYAYDDGYTELLSEKFDGDDVFEGSAVALDYQNSKTTGNATSTGVVFPANLAVLVGDNDGSDAKWVIDMPEYGSHPSGKASFTMMYPEGSTKDAKLVFHGRVYKGRELHRTLLALTVRANGELRLNNNTGNGRTFTLDDTITQGQPVPVEFTWDAASGGLAILSLKINGSYISASDFVINSDGTFESLAVASSAGLQANGPAFFEVQTKGGSPVIIDDFKVYSDVNGWNNIFVDNFNNNNADAPVTLDYQNSNTSGNSTSTAVDIENLDD